MLQIELSINDTDGFLSINSIKGQIELYHNSKLNKIEQR
jgi:hypothetical protein